MDFNDVKSRYSAEPTQQLDSDVVDNLDNATFIQELMDLTPRLANLDELIGQFVAFGSNRDAAEILGLSDTETLDSFLEMIRTKVIQLDSIRLYLRQNQRFPNRDLLQQLLEDAQPKCRQMAETVVRLKCSLAAESADKDGNWDNNCRDDDDKDDDCGGSNDDPGEKQQMSSRVQQQEQSSSSSTASNAIDPAADEYEKQIVLLGDNMEASALLMDPADYCAEELDNQDEEEDDKEEADSDDDDDDDDYPSSVFKPTACKSSALSCTASTALSVTDDWRQSTVEQNPKHIKIQRRNLTEDCISFYESVKGSKLRRILSVKFIGEPGIDMGALTREFFSLGFEALTSGTFKNQVLFEGQRGHLLPDPGADSRVFNYLGKMIVHAVVNDCRGFPGLSPAIVHYMTNPVEVAAIEDSHPPLSISDIADPELKAVLHKLEAMEQLTPKEQNSLENWMAESKCSVYLSSSASSRMLIIQHLLIYYVFTKRLRHIQALAAGLRWLNLLEFLIKNRTKRNMTFVFPSPDDVSITEGALLAAIVTRGDPPKQSGGDVSALHLFVQFVKELHENAIEEYGLIDLIRFMTSSPYLPHEIVVSFRDDNLRLPMAHVCYNEIQLPTVHRTYDEFKRAMMTALRHGTCGFDMH